MIVFGLWAGAASAEMIVLSDGTSINGRIIDQTDKKLKVEYNGQTVTYYADQIKSIDGKPFLVKKPEPEEKVTPEPQAKPPEQTQEITSLEQVYRAGKAKNKLYQSQSKRQAIKKFIDVVGTREQMTKSFDQMLANLQPNDREKMRKVLNVDDMLDNLMPVYDKYFTQDDLDCYIWFYTSESGQKLFKNLPLVMQESVDVSREYLKKKVPANLQ